MLGSVYKMSESTHLEVTAALLSHISIRGVYLITMFYLWPRFGALAGSGP